MNALLRLYPRAWRDRYGDELAALLDEQPATLLDRLDLIRGALDARMHPQVPGTDAAPEREIPMDRKLLRRASPRSAASPGSSATAIMFILPRPRRRTDDASVAFFGFAARHRPHRHRRSAGSGHALARAAAPRPAS